MACGVHKIVKPPPLFEIYILLSFAVGVVLAFGQIREEIVWPYMPYTIYILYYIYICVYMYIYKCGIPCYIHALYALDNLIVIGRNAIVVLFSSHCGLFGANITQMFVYPRIPSACILCFKPL